MSNTDDTTNTQVKEEVAIARKRFNETFVGQLLVEFGSSALAGLGDVLGKTFREYGVDGKPRNKS